MGNMMANASEFESGRLECGDQINNLLGIMFSQEVAHDISNRRVVTFAGKYILTYAQFLNNKNYVILRMTSLSQEANCF